jgi:hypothetical protein
MQANSYICDAARMSCISQFAFGVWRFIPTTNLGLRLPDHHQSPAKISSFIQEENMPLTNTLAANDLGRETALAAIYNEPAEPLRSQASAVSWGAIVAGAAAAAALSLILLLLGVGLGLAAASPWTHEGMGGAAFGVSTILWVTFTQLAASGMGGYLAGRLRTKWIAVHTDEVHFRDTAHGFLAWAIASLATAAMLTSTIGSIVNGGVQAGAAVVGGAAATAAAAGVAATSDGAKSGNDEAGMGYFVDSLLRKAPTVVTLSQAEPPASVAPAAGTTTNMGSPAEITRIFVSNLGQETLAADDTRYVGQIVAQRTGLTQAEAEKRVTDTYTRVKAKLASVQATAKEAADKARKASSYASLWLFISLLVGAFVASLAATYGGRHRDA